MPTYEYISTTPEDKSKSCYTCRKPFELRRTMDRAQELTCPLCGNPIKKLISQVAPPQRTTFSSTKAKSSGFTVLKNMGDGVLEKE